MAVGGVSGWASRRPIFCAFGHSSQNSRALDQSSPDLLPHEGGPPLGAVEDSDEKLEQPSLALAEYLFVHVFEETDTGGVSMEGSGTALEAPSMKQKEQQN